MDTSSTQQETSGTLSAGDRLRKRVVHDAIALQHNLRVVDQSRSIWAAMTGLAAGVLHLTGIWGFVFYVIASFALSGLLYFTVMRQDQRGASVFFDQPSRLWTDGISGGMLSFVLFWTLGYGLAHIYD